MTTKKTLSQKISALPPETRDEENTCTVTSRAAKRGAAKNGNLHRAKSEKNDEFYTRLEDIEAELKHYRKYFKGKVVLCNADDPEWSNFFRYFAINFTFLGLKKLIATHYEPSGKSYALVVDRELDVNGDGKIDLKDTVRVELEGNGDFRSEECKAYLKESDIVVTNIPFSLARDYLKEMKASKKKFLFLGNRNMITYKEFFAEIKENRMWLGVSPMSCTWFEVPQLPEYKKEGNRFKIENGKWYRSLGNACWFTNLPHSKRNTPLDLVGNVYSPEKYPKYDNYDAIEVAKVSEIPDGYTGTMGVPITFLDKYCPEQFEILGATESEGTGVSNGLWDATSGVKQATIDGVKVYKRIFIKTKKYPKYDNYDAIEVAKVSEIPDDYKGVMGVPITFLDKYCPEQFEILGLMSGAKGDNFLNGNDGKPKFTVNGKEVYARILIKAKPTKCTTGRQK